MCALVFGRLRFDLCWNAPGWHPPCLAAPFPCADVPPEKLFAYHMDLLGEGGKARLAEEFETRTDSLAVKVQSFLRGLVVTDKNIISQVGKASAEKPALSLNKERLLREGITTLGAFSKRYIKPVPAPAAKGGESAPAPEVEGAKLADGGPARSKQRRRTAAAAPAVAGSKRWR